MKYRQLAIAGLVLLSAAACASTPPRPVRSEFEDIPVPRGLTLLADESTVIESPSVKAARLVYRGRIQADSLALLIRSTLESNGWRHVSSLTTAPQGVTQVYDKAGNALQVQVWEGFWYTYVALTAGRSQQPPSAQINR
jgi:hypothetical protein